MATSRRLWAPLPRGPSRLGWAGIPLGRCLSPQCLARQNTLGLIGRLHHSGLAVRLRQSLDPETRYLGRPPVPTVPARPGSHRPHHSQPGVNPQSYRQRDAFLLSRRALRALIASVIPSRYGPHVVRRSHGLGIPKIDKGHRRIIGLRAIIAVNHLGTGLLIGADDVPVIFGIELGCQGGRVDEVNEHHRQLPSFGFWGRR